MLENGVIAKITSMISIIMIIITLSNQFDCAKNADLILPVFSGILSMSMTFLYVKKDKK